MSGRGSRLYNPASDQVVVLLPVTIIDRLDQLAKANGTTRSALIREAVDLYLRSTREGS
nr:ribbon-helix-helix protein, CopG family [uncultured Holophaga sp.]